MKKMGRKNRKINKERRAYELIKQKQKQNGKVDKKERNNEKDMVDGR